MLYVSFAMMPWEVPTHSYCLPAIATLRLSLFYVSIPSIHGEAERLAPIPPLLCLHIPPFLSSVMTHRETTPSPSLSPSVPVAAHRPMVKASLIPSSDMPDPKGDETVFMNTKH
jgi:hypothetical protein